MRGRSTDQRTMTVEQRLGWADPANIPQLSDEPFKDPGHPLSEYGTRRALAVGVAGRIVRWSCLTLVAT